ncbi:hypothetical protein ABZ920_19420 [Streptomyces sp. NPDC046831]|uniref:hypothetical protein n=1 Tax=Streptomyces sp. NPDC046831 TaxID=3154805 RepID=UPI0034001D52
MIEYELGMSHQERTAYGGAHHLEAAAECYRKVAGLLEGSVSADERKLFGAAMGNLAAIHLTRSGRRPEEVERAIAACKRALSVQDPEVAPREWGVTQHNLGEAYRMRARGSPRRNLEHAVAAYEAALRVRPATTEPVLHERTSAGLAHARRALAGVARPSPADEAGTAGEDARNLSRRARAMRHIATAERHLGPALTAEGDASGHVRAAIDAYVSALALLDERRDRRTWGAAQHNLACLHLTRRSGPDDLERAVTGYQAALRVRTREREPELWASTQYSLASAYLDRKEGDRARNIDTAVRAAEAALPVLIQPTHAEHRAKAMHNLGLALLARFQHARLEHGRDGDPDDLVRGIRCLEEGMSRASGRHGVTQAHAMLALGHHALADRTLDRRQSREYLARSLSHFRQARGTASAEDSTLRHLVDRVLARAYGTASRRGERASTEEAIAFAGTALDSLDPVADREGRVLFHHLLGDLYLRRQDGTAQANASSAADAYRSCLAAMDSTTSATDRADVLRGLGDACRALGGDSVPLAAEAYRAALGAYLTAPGPRGDIAIAGTLTAFHATQHRR